MVATTEPVEGEHDAAVRPALQDEDDDHFILLDGKGCPVAHDSGPSPAVEALAAELRRLEIENLGIDPLVSRQGLDVRKRRRSRGSEDSRVEHWAHPRMHNYNCHNPLPNAGGLKCQSMTRILNHISVILSR